MISVDHYDFGEIEIDGRQFTKDVVIHNATIVKRKKKASKQFKHRFGHTPLSAEEPIPWDCTTLIVGTGKYGQLPVMKEVTEESKRRGVDLQLMKTDKAIQHVNDPDTNLVLHLTC
jgi:hypothetical protein